MLELLGPAMSITTAALPAQSTLRSWRAENKFLNSAPSHRIQCLLFTLRMLVVPPSGSIRSNSLKSTVLPLACSFSARFLVASISAFDDDGIPHRAVALGSVAHDRRLVVRKTG